MIDKNKAKGALYGLYVGDALGAPLEFLNLDGVDPVKDYIEGGVHNVRTGQFTDDTSMTLALMHSIVEKGFDKKDQMDKYLSWMMNGEYSSKGFCFDIGIATQRALNNYKITGIVESGSKEDYSSGNGSLMRIAPALLYSYKDGEAAMIDMAKESSVTTHGSQTVLDSLTYFTSIFHKVLSGEKDKDKLLEFDPSKYGIDDLILIEDLLNLDIKTYDKYDLKSSGYIVHTMVCVLWSFYHTDNFEDAIVNAINLGDSQQADPDTIGAITGQLAGAYYGYDNIPERWLKGLSNQDMLDGYTNAFLDIL
ncbi:MAG: ADP-ribosylglycohydrolase [Chloroflexi bacterium]|nr:ADP-ribosylglycohydrolase [Chloroflexota bacterium]|tara:strand:- start:69456 stop:70376 length:921 start_codon:yes stop_codon:yes gene_type:complete